MALLKPEAIESLLREEIRRRRVNSLFEAADRLAALDGPLTETEVEAEIAAVRVNDDLERRNSCGGPQSAGRIRGAIQL